MVGRLTMEKQLIESQRNALARRVVDLEAALAEKKEGCKCGR
jgi:hypothetical protein